MKKKELAAEGKGKSSGKSAPTGADSRRGLTGTGSGGARL